MKRFKMIISSLWNWGIIVSIYVILAYILPCIRIPYCFVSEEIIMSFNDVSVSAAVSYLMGMLVYYLTVYRKNKRERKKRKWELDDLLKALNLAFELIETEIGRLAIANGAYLKNNCDDTTYNQFNTEFTSLLDKASLYKDIMTEEENDIIAEVRRLNGILINPPSMMDDGEAERCMQAIIEIRSNIDKLKQSFDKLLQRKGSPTPAFKS